MKKKQVVMALCAIVCVALLATAVGVILPEGEAGEENIGGESENSQAANIITTPVSLAEAKESFSNDIQALKDGVFENLIYHEFKGSMKEIESLHNLEIQIDYSHQDRTFLENFVRMKETIDKFFQEDFDKSYLVVDFHIEGEDPIYVNYNDIEKTCVDEKFNAPRAEFLFGNNTSEGGYMVQITEALTAAWFSKNGLGDIGPFKLEKKYLYLSGIRQDDDVVLHLKDGDISLKDMEDKVLEYLENDFSLPIMEEIHYQIGDVGITENGEYEGVTYQLRRVYKGVPFEHGTLATDSRYNDKFHNEVGMLAYAESTSPDTMLGFGVIDGTVVETRQISDILTLGAALKLLSEELGTNSIYDVYGAELVYRSCIEDDESIEGLSDKLVPKWKIITINQNDDKYTLFYVDVVTGEITERFEYYYGE